MKQNKSGKFVLRLPEGMHEKLSENAFKSGLSLNNYIVQCLKGSGSDDANSKIINPILNAFPKGIEGVILYGSTVRGEQRSDSDIDLLIITRQKINRKLYKIWDQLVAPKISEKYSPHFVDYPSDTSQIGSLWLEAASEGEFLYCQTDDLRRSVHQIKQQIASRKYVRKTSYGHSYWIKASEGLEHAE